MPINCVTARDADGLAHPMDPAQSFWRHREKWHYILKDCRLIRCTDGGVVTRGFDARPMAERLAERGQKVKGL